MQTALSLAQRIASKELSPREVAEATLDQYQATKDLNAIAFVDEKQLLEQAEKFHELWQKTPSEQLPPFFGVPIPIKSLTEVKGQPSTYGLKDFASKKASFDHHIVEALRSAGFMIFGQSTSPALGCLPVTEGQYFGITKNPRDPSLSPGGSSGGAAALVASGSTVIAHGSDGGGSLRIPAASCGIVGFKPSRGLLPPGPIKAWSGLSAHGVLTHTIEDQIAVLKSIHRQDEAAWCSFPRRHELDFGPGSWDQARVAVCTKSPFGGSVEPQMIAAVTDAVERLKAAGATCIETSLPFAGEAFCDAFILQWAAMMDVPSHTRLEPHLTFLIQHAKGKSALDLHRTQMWLQAMSRTVVHWLSQFDVLITPSLGHTPPKAGSFLDRCLQHPEEAIKAGFDFSPFSQWINIAGLPALSMPWDRATPIPNSIQIVGRPWQDDRVLSFGTYLESLRPQP